MLLAIEDIIEQNLQYTCLEMIVFSDIRDVNEIVRATSYIIGISEIHRSDRPQYILQITMNILRMRVRPPKQVHVKYLRLVNHHLSTINIYIK